MFCGQTSGFARCACVPELSSPTLDRSIGYICLTVTSLLRGILALISSLASFRGNLSQRLPGLATQKKNITQWADMDKIEPLIACLTCSADIDL